MKIQKKYSVIVVLLFLSHLVALLNPIQASESLQHDEMMSDVIATVIADDEQSMPYMLNSDFFKIKTMVFYEFIKTLFIQLEVGKQSGITIEITVEDRELGERILITKPVFEMDSDARDLPMKRQIDPIGSIGKEEFSSLTYLVLKRQDFIANSDSHTIRQSPSSNNLDLIAKRHFILPLSKHNLAERKHIADYDYANPLDRLQRVFIVNEGGVVTEQTINTPRIREGRTVQNEVCFPTAQQTQSFMNNLLHVLSEQSFGVAVSGGTRPLALPSAPVQLSLPF